LALLLLGGYGYRAVPTQAPRTNADASAAIPAQTAQIIGDASINVARESKAAFKATAKATVKTVAKQIIASIPALGIPTSQTGSRGYEFRKRIARNFTDLVDGTDFYRRKGTTAK
jgi:hypothetical protein